MPSLLLTTMNYEDRNSIEINQQLDEEDELVFPLAGAPTLSHSSNNSQQTQHPQLAMRPLPA